MKEYVRLVVWELGVGKVRLSVLPRHVAGRFVVGKQGTGRLHPVWNGSSLSAAAGDPPKPRRLANPASLLHILVEPDERLYYSKRDAVSSSTHRGRHPSLRHGRPGPECRLVILREY